MPVPHRPRRPLPAALTAVLTLLALAGCYGPRHPNSIFTSFTEWNRDVGVLFDILLWLGIIVFVFVEALLLYTIWRYRARAGQGRPEQVHGNTKLEILWTVIPALVLVGIAVPTVRTIFRTQAKAKPGALQVEVIGHQWWWEFRYPEYTATGANGKPDTLVTANELYLPVGRTVNFTLRTADVLHSFWIPALAGKRDLIANHTNYLWFTPDSSGVNAWNGFCMEYCGASHANMRFRAYTVDAEDFESWARHQLAPALGTAPVAAPTTQPGGSSGTTVPVAPGTLAPVAPGAATATASAVNQAGVLPALSVQPALPAGQNTFQHFPRERLGEHNVPNTPVPAGVRLPAGITGNAQAGATAFAQGVGACIGCHRVRGVPTALGVIGPNLTHFGGRHTIAAGLYDNNVGNLAAWLKNARAMKPGVLMPTLGKGQFDPITKARLQAGLTDQQAADLAAYLLTLK